MRNKLKLKAQTHVKNWSDNQCYFWGGVLEFACPNPNCGIVQLSISAQSSRSRLRRRQSRQRRRQSRVQRRQSDALSVGVRKENAQKVILGSPSLAMSQPEKCVWREGGPATKITRLLCTLALRIMRHL